MKPTIVVFSRAPALGTVVTLDEQRYELIGAEPYVRKTDGQNSTLLEWETTCPTPGCAESYRCSSGLVVTYLPRRCAVHRNPLKPVKGKRGRKVRVEIEGV